jgi:hypothetical protein
VSVKKKGRIFTPTTRIPGQLTDLSVDEGGDPLGADVQGVLGVSADGSDVYFVADGVLSGSEENANQEHAELGNCRISTQFIGNNCNLYLSQGGAVTFIARVDGESLDRLDWVPELTNSPFGRLEAKDSRVAANGTLLFGSTRSLTGYGNALPGGEEERCFANPTNRCREYYLYTPSDGVLTCISCDPSGAPPLGSASLVSKAYLLKGEPSFGFLTRNLSADGTRVFFDSPDPLVAGDTNGAAGCSLFGQEEIQGEMTCQDVYEWEARGAGSCHTATVDGGCLNLISTGKDPAISYFLDASASGDDVFFDTFQPLVGADTDELSDIYDARVNGGLASQYPVSGVPCLAEACRAPSTGAPTGSTVGTATFVGPGNPPPKACTSKQQKKTKACKPKKKKSKKKKQQQKKKKNGHPGRSGSNSTKKTNGNQGGSK